MANPTGKQLLRSSFDLLQVNKKLLWMPVLSGVSSLLIMGVIAAPLLLSIHGPWNIRQYLVVAFAAGVGSFATIFFNVALTYAAKEQIEGRIIGIGEATHFAFLRSSVIIRWAMFASVVGLVINAVERRVGIFSKVIGFLGALSWAVAVFFVIPILAFEELGPIDAVKRSSRLMKETFGTVTRSALRFGAIFLPASIIALIVLFVGIAIIHTSLVLGVAVVIVGFGALMIVGAYQGAAGAFLRLILYRYATGQSVPNLGVNVSNVFPRTLQ
jgi:hypothetical protein